MTRHACKWDTKHSSEATCRHTDHEIHENREEFCARLPLEIVLNKCCTCCGPHYRPRNIVRHATHGKRGNDTLVGTAMFRAVSKAFQQLFIRHGVDIHSTMLLVVVVASCHWPLEMPTWDLHLQQQQRVVVGKLCHCGYKM